MKKPVRTLAAKIASLQNDIDVWEEELRSLLPADQDTACRYRLTIIKAEARLGGMVDAALDLGFTVRVDGPSCKRTCVLELSGCYTSCVSNRRAI